ncbi:MAG: hypothetical protein HWN80_04840 [Candidatus Lokiarchaeota archaeon]|nr:hypothetical protein [Candidatus Lokiarchaeota archaeon]
MDTGYDFITPEFFNILFFKQKNLVIYPYVDVKHIHSLDCFTIGHDIIDIDSTGLENIHDIVEFETNNSYSQQPTFYYLLNVNTEDIEELLESSNIRCIINTSDNVEHLTNGNRFIFYNKKSKSFLNYQPERENLLFEQHLIQISQNEEVLLDEILKIKSTATKIYSDVNANTNSDNLPNLLSEYDQIYWDKILSFTGCYFNVEIPKFRRPMTTSKKKSSEPLRDFSYEYDFILKTNRKIGQKFIQLLHDYRFDKVNPANLEIDQLYYPKKLYNYLRNRHWTKGIPQDFITNWIQKLYTNSSFDEIDRLDFQIIFDKLHINPVQKFSHIEEIKTLKEPIKVILETDNELSKKEIETIPPIENFQEFKNWLLKKLDELQNLI